MKHLAEVFKEQKKFADAQMKRAEKQRLELRGDVLNRKPDALEYVKEQERLYIEEFLAGDPRDIGFVAAIHARLHSLREWAGILAPPKEGEEDVEK